MSSLPGLTLDKVLTKVRESFSEDDLKVLKGVAWKL